MLRRWAWLLVTGVMLGALVGAVVSILETPIYQSSTRILVMRAPQQQNADYTYVDDQQLVQTYIQLLTTQPVLQKAAEVLGSSVRSGQIQVQQFNDTSTILVTVEDENAQRASDIANILVQVLINQSENIQSGRYALTEQSIQAQVTQVESQIKLLETEINNISAETVIEQQKQVENQIAILQAEVTQLENEIQSLTLVSTIGQQNLLNEKESRLNQIKPVLELYQQIYTDLVVLGKPISSDDATTRLAQLQTTLQLYQQIYINLLNNLESVRLARLQNTPNVVQIEAASPSSKPVRPKPVTNIEFTAIIGLLIAGGIAFLIEYLDDTIRTPEDIEKNLKLPVIGYIGEMETQKGESTDAHVLYHPRSPVSEAFRSLRTNLEFTNVDQTLKKILVTSSGPGEGKTTIAINLAMIIAQGGKRVLLIDADMRRPRIHSIFGITNRMGLSTLFRANATVQSVMRPVEGINNIFIIPSGSLPPNPTELLASTKMDRILEEASQLVDIIIVDSPPSLVTDYQVLATKTDGVLLVIQPGHTRADVTCAMLEQIERVNARPLGVVLNKIPRNSYYYGNYHYYRHYAKGGYYSLPEQQISPQLPVGISTNQPTEERMEFYVPVENDEKVIKAEYYEALTPEPVEVYIPAKNMLLVKNIAAQPKAESGEFNPNDMTSYIIQKRKIEYLQDVQGD